MIGYVQVYTGDGKGKTTAALGLSLRAVCAGKNVFFGQFVKGREYSELKAVEFLPNFTMEQFGRPEFIHGKPSQADIDNARKAGLLHDIGKIGVRESVLLKPGRLTDEEFNEIKQHPSIGYNIIKAMDIDDEIKDAVLHHHERYDGRGYPDGLKGEEISLLSRILCVADSFDAMSSNRPYRKSLPPYIVW
jgi:putative nucleotidyltransferase with HDIG domain